MFPPPVSSPVESPARNHQSQESQEEFDSLFDSVAEEHVPSPKEEAPPPLSDNDLAVFDPCYKEGENKYEGSLKSFIWFESFYCVPRFSFYIFLLYVLMLDHQRTWT